MEEKSSADQTEQGNLQETEDIECDELLSAGASSSITENRTLSDKDEKPEHSQIQSESTSGVEMVSKSITSASEIPCEEAKTSDEEKEPLISESTSGIDISRSTTSASDIPCEGAEYLDIEENKLEPSPLPSEPTIVESISTTVSEAAQSEGASTSAVEHEGQATVSDVVLIPPKESEEKGVLDKVKGLLSPPKFRKSKKSRSKSMSPSNKSQPTHSGNSKAVSEAGISSGENSKKGSEKHDGVIQKIWRKCSKPFRKHSSESANLVPNEETDQTEEPKPSKLDDLPEPKWSTPCTCEPEWADNTDTPSSLSERQSLDGTAMTDIPSTWSDTEVFSSDSSKKPSETEENTSEAIAGSLTSSPDEEIPEIQKEQVAGSRCPKKDGPSDETHNVVAAENSKEKQSTSTDDPSADEDAQDVPAEESSHEKQSSAKDSESEEKKD